MICLACGANNPSANRFCGQCGARLVAAAKAPTEAATGAASAERRQLTLMFCDLVGSTALSGQLDPEDLREVMQAYRDAAVSAITRYDGHVAKYLGDGILAYFGYPAAHDDDAARAVSAGLAIVETMPALEARVGRPRGVGIRCRVGIATGPVVVGEMGEGNQRESMAVVGEAPNLADRLQSLAPHNAVVVSALTRQLVEQRFTSVSLGHHALKGLDQPAEAYLITGRAVQGRSASTRLPLTGRDAELSRLRKAFDEARAGRGRAVVLSGEPGIGKSRLIGALKNEALTRHRLWLEAQCSPFHADAPLHPAIDMLARALGFRRNEAPAERLRRIEAFCERLNLPAAPTVPLLATLLSMPDLGRHRLPALSPLALRARTLRVIVEVMATLARRRPLVLAVEDVHWVDQSTLDLLDLLIEGLSSLPVLLLITHRPEFIHQWPNEAAVEALPLGRLSTADGASLIRHAADGRALPVAVVSGILARSDGVPLFVEEITRAVIDAQGRKEGEAGTGEGSLEAVEIPATLKDSLMARLDRLEEGKSVAQAAAAIGRNFAYDLLSTVAGGDEASLRQGLRQLESAGLIQRRGEPPAAMYSFRHALIREIAYESMLRRRRKALHGAIAKALEASFPDIAETQPEQLGRHYARAGDEERAIGYYERAGRRAAQRSAFVEAVRHFERALELTAKIEASSPQLERKAALWSAIAPSLLVTRGYASHDVEEAYRRADELNAQLGDPARLFFSGWGISACRFVRGELGKTLDVLARIEADAEASGQEILRSITIMSRGVVLFSLGRFAESMTQIDQGLALYDPEQGEALTPRLGQNVSVVAMSFGAVAAWGMGRPDFALDVAHRALATARRTQHLYSLALILTIGVPLVHFRRGEVAVALEPLEEAIEISRENQFAYLFARATAMKGLIETRNGLIAEGLVHIREGIAGFRARGGKTTGPMMQVWLGDGLLSAKDPIAARIALQEGLALSEEIGEMSHLAEIHRLLGRSAAALGETDEAERCFREAYDTAERQGAFGWRLRAALDLGEHLRSSGRPKDAVGVVSTALRAIEGGTTTRDVRSAQAFLAAADLSTLPRA